MKKKVSIGCHLQKMWSHALKIQMNLDKASKELKLGQPTAYLWAWVVVELVSLSHWGPPSSGKGAELPPLHPHHPKIYLI